MVSVKLVGACNRFGWVACGSLIGLSLISVGLPAIAQMPEPSMQFPTEALPPTELPPGTVETLPGELAPPENTSPPASDFPASLVGGNVGPVVDQLRADGWIVIVRTPGLVQLDKGELGLDLGLDSATGEIVEAELLNI